MRYCRHCDVHTRGDHDKCVLCENLLEKSSSPENHPVYPDIPPLYKKHLALKIMIFISIVGLVSSFAITIIFASDFKWAILFMFAILSIWIGVINIIQKRVHIPRKILRWILIISLLSIFWDYQTGWEGWSLDYVFPLVCISAIIVMHITARVLNLSVSVYITYALIDGLLGIIPVLFIIFDVVNVTYPSIISIGFSIISLSALFIFRGKDIKLEIIKRMHI
ncbi:MAG TPA: DUF6320 domain-containing protein [Candidatus Eisenbacteria bacterium]|nr:DUF6320 domain-containing protein [Candidatus Eisenbacteria bacterium]